VRGLVDRLVDMGFEESEVHDNIETVQPELLDGLFGRQTKAKPSFQVSLDVPVAELKGIETVAPYKIRVAPDENGKARISVTDYPTPQEEARIFAAMPERHHKQFQEALTEFKAANEATATPAQRGISFVAPRLMATVQGELMFADNALFLEYHDWTLRDHSHQLSETEFAIQQVADTFEIDLDGDRLTVAFSDQTELLSRDIDVEGWTEAGLVQWLDRKVRDRFIGQGELIAWLGAVVSHLIRDRGIPLSSLMRCQFVLARCVQKKLAAIYDAESNKSYQMNLFGGDASPAISFDQGFKFFDGMFAGVRLYRGRNKFLRHFTGNDQVPAFDGKGENGSEGEELQCAVALDSIGDVKHWIRNVPQHPNAFYLPRAGGYHYPDFVAELKDGRTLVVEYKGQRGKSDPKEIESLNIGKKWQAVSDNKAVYCRVELELDGLDMRGQIMRAIR